MLLPLAVVSTAAKPNPIYMANQYMSHVATIDNGVQYLVQAPEAPLTVVHLFGSPYERGRAHGRLLSSHLLHFMQVDLPRYYSAEVASLKDELKNLPPWLEELVTKLLLPGAEKMAPEAFNRVLGWLEEHQRPYNNASRADVYAEMDGIADGVCEEAGGECDPAQLVLLIRRTNMLPELIKMQCSMLGAWGSATPGGSPVQLRALDVGSGPMANNSLLFVNHPTGARPFAQLGWPGMVGIITGFSPAVAISEKVNYISGDGPDKPAGSYDGKADVYVLRDVVQFADNKEDAVRIADAATRTWGIWLGVGDFGPPPNFVAMDYRRASAIAYDDASLPALTGQPPLPSVAYIDKHAQPSRGDSALPTVLASLHGNLTAATVAQEVPRATGSGDVHIAVYDFSADAPAVLLALGRTSANATFVGPGARYAYQSPFVRFDTASLWDEPPPRAAAASAARF